MTGQCCGAARVCYKAGAAGSPAQWGGMAQIRLVEVRQRQGSAGAAAHRPAAAVQEPKGRQSGRKTEKSSGVQRRLKSDEKREESKEREKRKERRGKHIEAEDLPQIVINKPAGDTTNEDEVMYYSVLYKASHTSDSYNGQLALHPNSLTLQIFLRLSFILGESQTVLK